MIRLIFLLITFTICLFANVKLYAPNSFIKDEPYIFTIEVSGNNIEFPNIDKIEDNVVTLIGNSSSTNIINGKISKSIKRTYSIYSKKEFLFPKLSFKIDGKDFFTNEKFVKINVPKKTNSSIFDLEIKTDKNSLYVGESFVLDLIFKYKRDAQIVDLNLSTPNFDGFWFKQLDESKKYSQGVYDIQELKFLLVPLKNGNLKINPITLNASILDNNRNFNSFFSKPTKNFKIYSNSLDFNIKSLPNGITLIGDFDIKAFIDKNIVNQNEAISYKIVINGYGNFEDIKDISLDSLDATIYDNKPDIKTKYENGLYKGVYTKVFSIVPNKNLVIPSISLKYFDKNSKTVIEKKTKAFEIKLKNANLKNEQNSLEKANTKTVEKVKIVEVNSYEDRVLFFFLGILLSVLILGLYLYVINQKNKKEFNEQPLIKKVKSSKTKVELLKVLAVYINKNSKLDELIFKVENSEDIKNLKKEILKLLKNINFKG